MLGDYRKNTYLGDYGHENFIVSLRIIVKWILMTSEFHGHLDSLFLGGSFLVLLLSTCGWLNITNTAASEKTSSHFVNLTYHAARIELLFISNL